MASSSSSWDECNLQTEVRVAEAVTPVRTDSNQEERAAGTGPLAQPNSRRERQKTRPGSGTGAKTAFQKEEMGLQPNAVHSRIEMRSENCLRGGSMGSWVALESAVPGQRRTQCD